MSRPDTCIIFPETGMFSYNHLTGEASAAPVVNAPGTVMDVVVFE
jgi:hypothetical protein